jgi:2-oxoglutarate ferredoxin oxidoreductase subunit alpha
MNTGQMVEDVRLAINGKSPVFFYGRPGGAMITPEDIERKIQQAIAYQHHMVKRKFQHSDL